VTSIYQHDCEICQTRCDGVSKGSYIFFHDVDVSELIEEKIIKSLNNRQIKAIKTTVDGNPDIEILRENGIILFFLEIKVQRRTFMAVKRLLPHSDLIPSNTIALNLSDLLRYFRIREETGKEVFLLWALQERPCVLGEKKIDFFYQNSTKLLEIYNKYKDSRRFRRRSGFGDIVDGVHKGVVVNYHFSLSELIPFDIDDFEIKIKDMLQGNI
jgi:hypothetical protein